MQTMQETPSQVYNLKVQLEDSTDTDITYARLDRTIASVDLDNGTITAELPANVGNDTTTAHPPT